ncbi:MAG TPA: arginine deiminase family protein [Thermoanaerobaculia bacterium]|nr:arginine deiminase family protein [Thermoanaerobaculia bacterium]
MPTALVRPISPRLPEAVTTYIEREPIDVGLAARQHHEYEQWLEKQGCRLVPVEATPDLPDGVFVEDAAIVLDEVAVITRPGAKSRRPEVDTVAAALEAFRRLERIEPPGTLDGGDVIIIDRTLYAGRGQRTNDAAISQLARLVRGHGYTVIPVDFTDCLHLKTAATVIAPDTLLINPRWADPSVFGLEFVAIDPREPFAANALRIGDRVLLPAEFPRTRRILQQRGFEVDAIGMSELLKAEAGVTCCCLVF